MYLRVQNILKNNHCHKAKQACDAVWSHFTLIIGLKIF
jgi:hypothetical protein